MNIKRSAILETFKQSLGRRGGLQDNRERLVRSIKGSLLVEGYDVGMSDVHAHFEGVTTPCTTILER